MNRNLFLSLTLFAVALVATGCGTVPPPPDTGREDSGIRPDARDTAITPDTNTVPDTSGDTQVVTEGGTMCFPSYEDPTCSRPGMSGCTCNIESDVEDLCRMTPAYRDHLGTCQPGHNECGINLPPHTDYSSDGYMTCYDYVRNDFWTFPGVTLQLQAGFNVNQQVTLRVPDTSDWGVYTPSRSYTWYQDRFLSNWAMMNEPGYAHCWIRFEPGCRVMYAECFSPGVDPRGMDPNTTEYRSLIQGSNVGASWSRHADIR